MNGNSGKTLRTLARCIREATVEVFNSYGLSVRPVDFDTAGADALEPVSVIGAIGCTGDSVRDASVLSAPQSVVQCWAAAASADESMLPREIVVEFST